MNWIAINWFGGFKVECPQCHHYAVSNSEDTARVRMRAYLIDGNSPNCSICSLEMELMNSDRALKERLKKAHEEFDVSLTAQLSNANKEIKNLKDSIDKWKDAWFQMREIVGDLWFHHPSLDSEEGRAYYQNNLKILNEEKCQSLEKQK